MVVKATMIVPLKSFANGKARLAPVLDASSRERLSRECADRVVASAGNIPVVIVTGDTDSESVYHWARERSATCITQTSPGLNGAVADGVEWARRHGFDVAIIAHSDVPLAHDVAPYVDADNVVIVPDSSHDGTNLMSIPTTADFAFHYGPGSFALHVDEAMRRGFAPRVALSDEWSHDLDTPDDLNDPRIRKVFPWLPTSQASPQ